MLMAPDPVGERASDGQTLCLLICARHKARPPLSDEGQGLEDRIL
jgi:hypothetical protein